MKSGVGPTLIDPRDKRFRVDRVFGSAVVFPTRYDADSGKTMPDQDADNRPTACTAYTVTEIGLDQDGEEYSVDFNFMKTLQIMGKSPDYEGANARDAFKVAATFGLLPKKLQPKSITKKKTQAFAADQKNWPAGLDTQTVIKPAYLPVFPTPFQDWFDAIRSALLVGKKEKRTIGGATPWYAEFNDVGPDGILNESPTSIVSWHMYKITGWTDLNTKGEPIRNGEVFLKCKVWQGKKLGDKGWVYMSRPLANKVLKVLGTYAATLQDLPMNTIDELRQRDLNLLEVVLALIQNIYIRMRYAARGI